ncbi:hypothetical protein [Polyangium sp. 6x1]|uniref:hypothetical protein n=1 Tax=Polyangium sp. 6x1 TaxID=3042689 RepID=UPI00248230C5|nr:hypothetical protein [Polyangium sp. 6x1]MDI1443851.1 hypothetical protein [Polyangium sp. 6x1]
MKRAVVLGVNQNPDYLFCLPLVAASYAALGYRVLVNVVAGHHGISEFWRIALDASREFAGPLFLPERELRGEWSDAATVSVAQLVRLDIPGMKKLLGDTEHLTLGDADMMVFDQGVLEVEDTSGFLTWGHDLCGGDAAQWPMCYVIAPVHVWEEACSVVGITESIPPWEHPLVQQCLASERPLLRWIADQELLTHLLRTARTRGTAVVDIPRGTSRPYGLATGRYDRVKWMASPGDGRRIDCHLPKGLWRETAWRRLQQIIPAGIGGATWTALERYREVFVTAGMQ